MGDISKRKKEKSSLVHKELVYNFEQLKEHAPKIFGIPTGTKLDELFFKVVYDKESDSFKKIPLNGIPSFSILNITGIADTGKSLLGEQFALTQASLGYKVLFVTVESPAHFLYTAFKERAKILDLNFDEIEKNIIVVDASSNFELRDNIYSFLETIKYAIEKKGTTITVIDSITGLYEHKEMVARQIVREIYNFLKKHNQTAMLISQKRSSQSSDTAEAAGGLAVAHIVDGTIVLSKKIIETKYETSLYKIPIGNILRTIRIDGCRITPHDERTYVFEIESSGLINIIMPLSDFISKEK